MGFAYLVVFTNLRFNLFVQTKQLVHYLPLHMYTSIHAHSFYILMCDLLARVRICKRPACTRIILMNLKKDRTVKSWTRGITTHAKRHQTKFTIHIRQFQKHVNFPAIVDIHFLWSAVDPNGTLSITISLNFATLTWNGLVRHFADARWQWIGYVNHVWQITIGKWWTNCSKIHVTSSVVYWFNV